VLAHDVGAHFIELGRGHAGPDSLFHSLQHLAHNRARGAHPGKIFWTVDRHSASQWQIQLLAYRIGSPAGGRKTALQHLLASFA
jgi:hypothetical protein